MAVLIQHKRGTAAEWAALNPVLKPGELGFEKDTKIIKLGDGVTAWNDLDLGYLRKDGGTLTGALNLIAPTANAHAARKLDVDNASAALNATIADLPQGVLDYSVVTASQAGISAETNLTGLSVTIDVPAGRLIRIAGQSLLKKVTTSGNPTGHFKEGSTKLGRWAMDDMPANGYIISMGSILISPSAGEHTYVMSLEVASGTIESLASATYPAHMIAEDLGLA